jgi:asparagine synthase (glutamine-hydrolysing)
MAERLAHRGPDGKGVLSSELAVLAHRRLAVRDPRESAAQPMRSACGRYALAYNGELYNDAELRRELSARGIEVGGSGDTAVLLHALMYWGERAASRLRGMYAFVFVDFREGRALLARDPMGIKPLHTASAGSVLLVASEPTAIVESGLVRAEADASGVVGYLMTIRTVLGRRTMYRGVESLEAGEWRSLSLGLDGSPRLERSTIVETPSAPSMSTREVIEDSVRRHLRSDVPLCALLSGGLDSTIVAMIARRELGGLSTYCAGSPGEADDFAYAKLAAGVLRTRHVEATVDEAHFARSWPEMVDRLGVPLSTPNEVAIREVARAMREDGHKVALSGEGADELFGGYDSVLRGAVEVESSLPSGAGETLRLDAAAWFWLGATAWVPLGSLKRVIRRSFLEGAEEGGEVVRFVRARFARCMERGEEPMQAHLRYQRAVNLEGLLRRLDTATMLEGVEGRTPFADAVVASHADSLPFACKFDGKRGKVALREAFGGEIPPEVLRRAKASFPLPFERWLPSMAWVVRESEFVRTVFEDEAVERTCESPAELWRLAWPMFNLALWGRRFEGSGPVSGHSARSLSRGG